MNSERISNDKFVIRHCLKNFRACPQSSSFAIQFLGEGMVEAWPGSSSPCAAKKSLNSQIGETPLLFVPSVENLSGPATPLGVVVPPFFFLGAPTSRGCASIL